MILTHITAMSKNRVIGSSSALPWNLPEDMKFFKDTTKGHIMILGRKTFETFGGQPLPQRYHIVITRQDLKSDHPMVRYVRSLEEAVEVARPLTEKWGDEVFIAGGGEIYKQSMPITDKIYLTVIHKDFEGDTYYPEVPAEFKLTEKRDRTEPIPFSFCTYERVRT